MFTYQTSARISEIYFRHEHTTVPALVALMMRLRQYRFAISKRISEDPREEVIIQSDFHNLKILNLSYFFIFVNAAALSPPNEKKYCSKIHSIKPHGGKIDCGF
jgi:hypothetical protein